MPCNGFPKMQKLSTFNASRIIDYPLSYKHKLIYMSTANTQHLDFKYIYIFSITYHLFIEGNIAERKPQPSLPILRHLFWNYSILAALVLILLCAATLPYPGLNFVFGLANELNLLAVVSTARFTAGSQASRETTVDRAVKTALHEAGHLLGLQHCNDQRCVMVLSFALSDTDFKRKDFCETCKKKMERGWLKR